MAVMIRMFSVKIILLILLIFICVVMDGEAKRKSDEERRKKANLVQQLLKKYQKKEGHIRLVGGKTEFEGNVEILHNNKWGAVCDDEWSKEEAIVVCKQLRFGAALGHTHSAKYGVATRKYWMDNIYCDGSEDSLSSCRFDGWGVSDCIPSEAAGVKCQNPNPELLALQEMEEIRRKEERIAKKTKIRDAYGKDLLIRLQGGRSETEGRVEVYYGNTWGCLCGDGWSLIEGNVVCKSLGLGYAMAASQSSFFNANSSAIVLSGIQCNGTEESLSSCLHDILGDVICPGDNSNLAGVICVKEMADLIFDHYELMRTAHLEDRSLMALQCAMEENCLGSQAYAIQKENNDWFLETRRLLKFTASVLNAGTADFRPAVPKHLWEWHMCHMHYHSMEVFATFDVLDYRGVRVAEGHKASFCLEDNTCQPGTTPKYACANYGDQGISVNCSDIYKFSLDCQWVDISEINPGMYTLKVSVNPEMKVPEMSWENNAAVCTLMYTETSATVYDCKLQKP